MTKIFFVDRFIVYSTKMFESMLKITSEKKDFEFLFLGPDDKKSILFSDRGSNNSKKIWSRNHYVRKLLNYISKNEPDLVNLTFELRTYGSLISSFKFPILLFLLRIKKQKIIVNLFTTWFFREENKWKLPSYFPSKIPKPIISIFIKIFFSIVIKLSDKIIVGTNQGKFFLVDYYGIDEDKVHVIPFGISPLQKSFNQNKKKKFEELFEGKKIILYFGIISPRKNHQTVIRSFEKIIDKIPNHILVIAGDSTKEFENYKSDLHKLVKELQLDKHVIFTGFIDNDEIDILFEMAESTLFLYSPMSDSTFATTIAIQYQKPIIASDIEIIKEIFPVNSALFVDHKNISQISDALLQISTNPETRKNLVSNVSKLAKKYTWENCAANYLATYESIL